MSDFGIIIACCRGDYHLLQGLCASIRYFMSETPICLLVDGDFSVSALRKAYGVQEIRKSDIHDPVLRNCFGSMLIKYVALYSAPWPTFLYVDADSIILGNISHLADFDKYDFICDEPLHSYSDADVNRWFFDTQALSRYFPEFDWTLQRCRLFNAGVWFGKCSVIPRKRFNRLIEFYHAHPGVFKLGDQGLTNFLFLSATEAGEVRLDNRELQLMAPNHTTQILARQFEQAVSLEVNSGNGDAVCPRIMHWCGPKPTLSGHDIYSYPMNYFRRQAQSEVWGRDGLVAEIALRSEDFRSVHSRQLAAQWRHLVARAKSRLRSALPR